ncbi:MAG: PQQ-like beta-propeller repeat protein [Myxococcales bacterium]|nr:PQQ-like beta-propeller repeat protein [Myxococcales bacterium]
MYVGSQDDHLYCISADGQLLWSRNMGQDIDSSVAFGPDDTLYVGVDDGGVYALR